MILYNMVGLLYSQYDMTVAYDLLGDSVTLNYPGDAVTLSLDESIDSEEDWKLCLSLAEVSDSFDRSENLPELLMFMVIL